MNTSMRLTKALGRTAQATMIAVAALMLFMSNSYAGEEEWSEKAIQNEIGFLAQKLLDMSGKDSYECDVKSFMKPFMGICSDIKERGIKLTCVTPGTQADKGGLRTGDYITKINDIDVTNEDLAVTKKAYYGFVEKMKIGDVINFELLRGDEKINKEVTVGTRKSPSFSLKVGR